MNILKYFRKKSPALDQIQTTSGAGLTPMLYLERWGNMAKKLTPSRLEAILQAADDGDIVEQHVLFADMEDRCEHLAAEMGKRKRALLTLDWEILPGRARDKQAERVAQAVREQFEAFPAFEDMLLDMADGIGHGFSALEITWDRVENLHLPTTFTHRPQSWFQVLREDRNQLRLRDGTVDGAELWPFGWVVHTHRSKSGWLPRAGLFRCVAWTYLIRAYALESAILYTQVHGLPFRLGVYPPGSSDEDKTALRSALANLGRDASGIIPQGMEIQFQTPANATQDVPGMLVSRCEQGMSKAILGGTLTSQADGKTSTNALGNVHNEVRHDLLVSDAVQIAATLTRQVLTPLAVLNCGVSDPALLPWFRFDTREAEDIAVFADALPKLAPVMRISRKWAHEKLKIPIAESEDDVLGSGLPSPSASLAMLKTATPSDPFPDQTALDGLDLEDALQQASDTLLAPLMADIQAGADPDEMLSRLGELYPRLNAASLEDLLARAFFVADLWGRHSAESEVDHG